MYPIFILVGRIGNDLWKYSFVKRVLHKWKFSHMSWGFLKSTVKIQTDGSGARVFTKEVLDKVTYRCVKVMWPVGEPVTRQAGMSHLHIICDDRLDQLLRNIINGMFLPPIHQSHRQFAGQLRVSFLHMAVYEQDLSRRPSSLTSTHQEAS